MPISQEKDQQCHNYFHMNSGIAGFSLMVSKVISSRFAHTMFGPICLGIMVWHVRFQLCLGDKVLF